MKTEELAFDPGALREEVKSKYRDVAINPGGEYPGERVMLDTGFVDIQISEPYDTLGEARGEKKARLFDVYGYTFLARKPR